MTTQLNVFRNLRQPIREQWGSQVVGAALLADAADAVVADSTTITTGANNRSTIGKMTIVTTTNLVDH